ncbi:hypothetical protein ACFQ07_22070, partial [Actinomadura adrarensis]
MQRERIPVPAPDALVSGLYDDFADQPVEMDTVRRCVEDLWSCCLHLGIRPEEKTIAGLALSRLTGIVKGTPPSGGDSQQEALSVASREMTDEKDLIARTADGERAGIRRAQAADGDRMAQLRGAPGGGLRGTDRDTRGGLRDLDTRGGLR